jgi:hypothetical protein
MLDGGEFVRQAGRTLRRHLGVINSRGALASTQLGALPQTQSGSIRLVSATELAGDLLRGQHYPAHGFLDG